jgi:DNA-binding response OmpR family regulator
MKPRKVLIVENETRSLQVICRTLDEAGTRYEVCGSVRDAWDQIRMNPDFTEVLLRLDAETPDALELCRGIREVKSMDKLPILVVIDEKQLEHAAKAIEAGVNEVLAAPFEARELRMRMNLQLTAHQRRFDQAHVTARSEPPAAKVIESGDVSQGEASATQPLVKLLIPQVDPASMKMTYDASAEEVAEWKNSEAVGKVALDQIMTCPCCGGLPTFRPGCGACGSAFSRREKLVHHYSCAHIGSESEFRQGDELVCPKCLQKNLVAGSDFETVSGGYVCADCGSRSNIQELIGHCMACQHRFPASEAVLVQLTGLYVAVGQEQSQSAVSGRPATRRTASMPQTVHR